MQNKCQKMQQKKCQKMHNNAKNAKNVGQIESRSNCLQVRFQVGQIASRTEKVREKMLKLQKVLKSAKSAKNAISAKKC